MDKNFAFRETDSEGLDTLNVIEKADKFNEWMYQTIKPYCKGDVFEVGSGIGNISEFFVRDGYSITLSDIREGYCEKLDRKFSHSQHVKGISLMDLTDPDFATNFKEYIGSFDTVFALNVVEHIESDQLAIQNCHKLLRPSGRLIILVPAYQALYNRFDTELEHYRRYTVKNLNKLFINSGFRILHSQYFNLIGIIGWFVSGKIQKNKTIPEGQMELYNKLVPIFKLADKLFFNKFGLSAISVGVKE